MRLPRRTLLALAAGSAAAGLALAAATPALAAGPTVNYSETGSCPGAGGQAPCTTHITIDSNPNNARVRAWEACIVVSNGTTFRLYGGYHTSVGATSNTASCASVNSNSYVTRAGFQYGPSNTEHL